MLDLSKEKKERKIVNEHMDTFLNTVAKYKDSIVSKLLLNPKNSNISDQEFSSKFMHSLAEDKDFRSHYKDIHVNFVKQYKKHSIPHEPDSDKFLDNSFRISLENNNG